MMSNQIASSSTNSRRSKRRTSVPRASDRDVEDLIHLHLRQGVPGPINRHNRRGDDELSRRYRRMREEGPPYRDELDDDPYEDIDEYWNPRNAASPLDFHLQLSPPASVGTRTTGVTGIQGPTR